MHRPDAQPDPFAPVLLYRSADWQPDGSEGLPVFRHDWEALQQQCLVAVARREKAYPELIRAGRMAAEAAARDLDAWRALAAEWRWILSGEGEVPSHATLPDRIAAVDLALERVGAELARRRTDALLCQRHLLEALAWNLGDGRGAPPIHDTARFNHAWGRTRTLPAPGPFRSAA